MWVKLHDVPMAAYTGDKLSVIASKLGTPMLLDLYTNTTYEKSWGRNSYARTLIELNAENEFKQCLVDAVPLLDDAGYTMMTICVAYEWTPPRCDLCNIFGHINKNARRMLMLSPR